MKWHVVQLAKAPVLNHVKTRMQPYLSAEAALALHKKMTHFIAQNLSRSDQWGYELSASTPHPFFVALSKQLKIEFSQQVEGDLGYRLKAISDRFFSTHSNAGLILIGSDCPLLSDSLLGELICRLQNPLIDLAIIPATDGGYVAMGIKQHHSSLFEGISWGTDKVLEQTLKAASAIRLVVEQLEPLPDIDRPEDLPLLTGVLDMGDIYQ